MARSPYLWALLAYVGFSLLVFREGGFGASATLPEGTNALNAWVVSDFFQHHALGVWLFPYTDWGQPVPGFTGPTLLTPLMIATDPTVFVRVVEFAAIVGAGLAMMATIRAVGGTAVGGFLGGFFYAVFAQTSQLFEGHVQAMVSIALAPLFLYEVWGFFRAPTVSRGLPLAILLYALVSIGDLGMLYFYLFFAIPLAGFTIVRRQLSGRYRLKELGAVVFAAGLTTALSLSWLYPFIGGLRPEYTTNITVQVLPFSATSGENIALAFTGFIQDNSFVHFTYHQFSYALGGGALLPLAFLLPLAIGAYVIVGRRIDRVAFYASGFVAMIFATGHLYPGLSAFNEWVYDHVPYFDSIPALFRWVEYTLVVYGVLLGLLLSDFEREARAGYPRLGRFAGRLVPGRWRSRGGPLGSGASRPTRAFGARQRRRALHVVALSAVVVVLVLLPNWSVVSEPPGVFDYPAQYTASFSYIQERPVSGEVLSIPFGGIYDRAPWGGVSASAALLTPAYTGADTAIFEAGTSPSLALDRFIGDGLTFGGSRNMTEFLGSVNVQYIVANRYSDWNFSSSSEYAPALSYSSLSNQTGLGQGVALSSVQTIYAPGNSVGNLSFHPSYLLYFGADSILYSVLDSSWYPGPSMALVNGSSVGADLSEFILHAAGIVVTPSSLATLGASFVAEARSARVPLIEIVPPSEFTGVGTVVRPDAWNATGGVDLEFLKDNATAQIDLASNLLSAAGYANLSLAGQVAAPPGATGLVHFANSTNAVNLSVSSILGRASVNFTAPGFVHVSADNETANYSARYNLSYAGGVPTLAWDPEANYSSDQYLNFTPQDLRGWNGVAIDVAGGGGGPLELVICHERSCFALSGHATLVPIATNLREYRFLFPSGQYGMPPALATNLSNLTAFALRSGSPSPAAGYSLSNLSLLRVSTPGLVAMSFGAVPADTTQLGISLPPTSRLGFLEVASGPFPVARPFERDLSRQSEPTGWTYHSHSSGWGLLSMAQTASPLWSLSGPGPARPATVDVGLQGWLLNDSNGSSWQVSFVGDALERTSLPLEAAAVTLLVAPLLVYRLRRRRARRARSAGTSP